MALLPAFEVMALVVQILSNLQKLEVQDAKTAEPGPYR